MFHKEGFKIIIISFFLVAIICLTADAFVPIPWVAYSLQGVSIALLIIILQFFRNPKRAVQFNHNQILAPVDGKIVVMEEVVESEFFKDKRKQVSIFMSPFNVHVTRYPASGVIQYSKYHPGKYLVAWHPKSSEENERTTIVVKTPKFGDILYRQIAGALARRIVNYAKKGDSAIQGADAGFIKFGSRVDLFLPLDCVVITKLNQKVIGAKTVIAVLKEKDE